MRAQTVLLKIHVSCLAFALLVLAPTAKAADRANIEAFLDVTGFDAALDSIAFSASDAPVLLGMEPNDFGHDWTRVSREVFDTAKMQNMAIDILAETLSADLLGHAASFYASPLGQRLVEVENASHRQEDTESKRVRGDALVAEAASNDRSRLAALERLNKAVDSSENAVRAFHEVVVRFMMAASHSGVLGYQIDEDTLRALLKLDEDELHREMQISGTAHAAFTYRDISTDDLNSYAEALEHPKMRQVYELMNAVQFEIMANRFEALAVRMANMHPGEEL